MCFGFNYLIAFLGTCFSLINEKVILGILCAAWVQASLLVPKSAWFSHCCCHKLPQTKWLKTAAIYYSPGAQKSNTVSPDAWNPDACRTAFLSGGSEDGVFLYLSLLLETIHTCLWPPSSVSLPILPSGSLFSLQSPCKDSSNQVAPTYIIQDNFPISRSLRLIISSKSPYSCQVI